MKLQPFMRVAATFALLYAGAPFHSGYAVLKYSISARSMRLNQWARERNVVDLHRRQSSMTVNGTRYFSWF
jgi:hypothetical protein